MQQIDRIDTARRRSEVQEKNTGRMNMEKNSIKVEAADRNACGTVERNYVLVLQSVCSSKINEKADSTWGSHTINCGNC